MNYELSFDEKALLQLEKLPRETKKRIFEKLTATKKNPFHCFESLQKIRGYKLRIGDYRAIAEIKEGKIIVMYVGHRKNIYKKG